MLSSSYETGTNYSLLVGYQLKDRWSISTDRIWSMKKYSTYQKVRDGKYTEYSMVGACRILDIQVNVNYSFRSLARTSFYAGFELSCYIMLEEDYTYTFNTSSGTKNFTYNIDRKNNEWLKILNVSFGMQSNSAKIPPSG